MAITYSYPLGTPKLTDTVLGVQYEEMKDPAVKNFSIDSIVTLAVEEIGNITQGPTGPQGPTGAQGVQGNPGTPGAVGPAGLEWQGAWNKNNSYIEDDAVSFSGASYFCILAIEGSTLNQNPPNDATHWALLAAQGAQGIQGVQGATGSQGPAGTISYTEGSLNTNSSAIAGNPTTPTGKITKNFTRAYVTSSTNNFIGLSNIGKNTGDFYVVQNKSTTLDLVVIPVDGAEFLQPNGFSSQVNFTVKANTYARFTLADNNSGSAKTFMVEVIKPLGAAPTLQQVTNEGANSYGNTINLKNTSISDSTIQFNVSDFFEPFIKVENAGVGSSGHFTKLGSSTIEFDGSGDYNTILAAGAGLNNTVTLPSESGTLALTSDIVTKIVKTTITQAQILQMYTTPIPILNSTTTGIAKIPLNIFCKRSGTGTAYTIASNQFSLVSNSGSTFSLALNNNILSSTVPVSYTNFNFNGNFQIAVGADNEIYKLGFYTSNPTGGTGDMDVYVTYIEITL
jgi:hypothetical protein